MNTFRKLNTRAKKAGFTTREILLGYLIVAIVACGLSVGLFFVGEFYLNYENNELTEESAEKLAKNFYGLEHTVIDTEVVDGGYKVTLESPMLSIHTVTVIGTQDVDKPVKYVLDTEK